jgi:hypothetical protein
MVIGVSDNTSHELLARDEDALLGQMRLARSGHPESAPLRANGAGPRHEPMPQDLPNRRELLLSGRYEEMFALARHSRPVTQMGAHRRRGEQVVGVRDAGCGPGEARHEQMTLVHSDQESAPVGRHAHRIPAVWEPTVLDEQDALPLFHFEHELPAFGIDRRHLDPCLSRPQDDRLARRGRAHDRADVHDQDAGIHPNPAAPHERPHGDSQRHSCLRESLPQPLPNSLAHRHSALLDLTSPRPPRKRCLTADPPAPDSCGLAPSTYRHRANGALRVAANSLEDRLIVRGEPL